ncbi:MAG: hypothetical protein IPK03_15430 [Bacteroidetes bacterium]|nr:hypothetical protein [Bacteroidota bacterium]
MRHHLNKYIKISLIFCLSLFIQNTGAQSFHPGLSAKFQQTIDSLKTAQNVKELLPAFSFRNGMWRRANGISNGTIPIQPRHGIWHRQQYQTIHSSDYPQIGRIESIEIG